MQDRFKFRGKRLDNGKWYYGSYLYLHNAPQYNWNGDKTLTKEDVHYIIDENDVNYGVDPETVGQCTGLKDKNGKLIYEGDIVKENWHIFIVGYCRGSYDITDIKTNKRFTISALCVEKSEIIGNIYENPELLRCKNV